MNKKIKYAVGGVATLCATFVVYVVVTIHKQLETLKTP